MKMCIVGPVYPFPGGIAQHTALLARHLEEHHEVKVISFRRQYPRWLVRRRTDRDPSGQALRLADAYLLDPLDPLSWWQTARQIAAWHTQVLILPWWVTFWAPVWLTLVYLARRWTETRVIFVCHNVVPHESNGLDALIARMVLRSGDGVIVQATEQMERLKDLLPGCRAICTPLPSYSEVNASELPAPAAARTALGLAPDQKVLLYFGFVRPYKGLHTLLDAMPAILSKEAVHLLVVGEMWENKTDYLNHIERLKLSRYVSLVDEYVPDEALSRYFGAADVAVLPYISATQSAVVQLAFGFGLPVIATRVGGLPDAIEHGQTGLLVPPGSSEALAQAVLQFYDEGLSSALRANIRNGARRFDWQHMVTAIERLVALP